MYDQSFLSVLEVAKSCFTAAYIIATGGVLAGVYLEKKKPELGWQVLIVSLAFEILFTILTLGIDHRISHIQRDEIIRLERILTPRVLSDAQTEEVKQRLSEFSGQTFLISTYPNDKEAHALAVQISQALTGARCSAEFSGDEMPPNIAGVIVSTKSPASDKAMHSAQELVKILKEYGIDTFEDSRSYRDPSDKVILMIGVKPHNL